MFFVPFLGELCENIFCTKNTKKRHKEPEDRIGHALPRKDYIPVEKHSPSTLYPVRGLISVARVNLLTRPLYPVGV